MKRTTLMAPFAARFHFSFASRRCAARAQVIVLVLAGFVAGAAVAGLCVFRAMKATGGGAPATAAANTATRLSETTLNTVKDLHAPVEIRFYSILDPSTVPAGMTNFAARVHELLSEYQEKSGGKIKVTRVEAQSYATAKAAQADGIKPFNIDKGDACYLGIAVVRDGQKQVFTELAPDAEPRLESELTKAIGSLMPVPAPAPVAQVDDHAIQELKQAVPDLASISLEDGTKMLREAALKEFSTTARDMQDRLKEAQERLLRVQNGGSAAEQQEAMQQLQQVQAQQTEQLKQIAARSQAQLEAFRQLKTK